MGPLIGTNRCIGRSLCSIAILAAIVVLAKPLAFAATPGLETVQATHSEAGNLVGVTLTVYNYSTPSDLESLSQAFQKGLDRELVNALSKTKAVGRCQIAGDPGYDIAFIQMVRTPAGRQIIFITSRQHPPDESELPTVAPSFDLAVGQFNLDDANPTMSTGFLFPASRLVVDDLGAFHYDLAGVPWALVNVHSSNGTPLATRPNKQMQLAPTSGRINHRQAATERNCAAVMLRTIYFLPYLLTPNVAVAMPGSAANSPEGSTPSPLPPLLSPSPNTVCGLM